MNAQYGQYGGGDWGQVAAIAAAAGQIIGGVTGLVASGKQLKAAEATARTANIQSIMNFSSTRQAAAAQQQQFIAESQHRAAQNRTWLILGLGALGLGAVVIATMGPRRRK